MWREFDEFGQLRYNFLNTVTQIIPMYVLRAVGGTLFLTGTIVMVYNLIMTAKSGNFNDNEGSEAPSLKQENDKPEKYWHRTLEKKPVLFTILTLVAILIGGLIEMVPTFLIKSNVPTIASVKPYTPLELEGRDLYIREGCNSCHSQMIRPFRHETTRFMGEYSKAGEFVYDHPFLWGSKRTGPDLHRIGQRYPDSWHFNHMLTPADVMPGSIMPAYPWMFEQSYNKLLIPKKIAVMRKLGVPYESGFENLAIADTERQANQIVESLARDGIKGIDPNLEIVALISYLQRLGTDIKVKEIEKEQEIIAEK
jgi:cytochrome c oxidase cbb3-type subunit I/II